VETALTLLPTAVALVLYAVVVVAFVRTLLRGRRARPCMAERAPRVSILKPLAGADDDLEENLDSFAALDYPGYEVLLGVASMDDPAADVAKGFLRRHPELDARLVLTDPDAAVNPKVISDSNVRVRQSYLWSLVEPLAEPEVGMVTSIFVGTGERSIGAALENLQLGCVTAPAVIAAATLLREPLTVGKSMAVRRRDLTVLGALHSVKSVLAEDYVLGRIFLGAGYEVRTSLDAIENRNTRCSVRRTVERHSRWAKMRRSIAPGSFAFELMLSPLAVATLVALVAQSRVSVAAVLVSAALQTTFAFASLRALRGRPLAWYFAPLEIVRTYLALFCWARAWVSRRIGWRGHAFLLAEGSVIVPAPPSSLSRLLLVLTTPRRSRGRAVDAVRA
jgi:ceramide glucosyltransferase